MHRWILVLTALALAGCSSSGDEDDVQKFGTLSLFDPVPALGSPIVPFPFDGLFSGFSDPTLNIPNGSENTGSTAAPVSFVTAANRTDGFSTTASIFTDLVGFVDYSTAAAAVVLINSSTGQRLQPGVDYLVQPSTAIDGSAPQIPINQKRSRLLIELLRPLAPSTRYLVAVTTALTSTDGVAATASDLFKVARSATPVSQQQAAVLSVLTAIQLATLEVVRSQLIRPAVQGIMALTGVAEGDLVIAWSFTTQSTAKTLTELNRTAAARPIAVAATGLNTNQINPNLQGYADVYVGTVTVPYYLANTSVSVAGPVSAFWLADTAQPDANAVFLGQVPCTLLLPSQSTTICYPIPAKRSDETIPLMVTVPNASSLRSKPANGWPIVIFQHGITGNRTQMLAIAPTLAQAGFVTAAIDLPLHGITDSTSALYRNQLFTGSPAAGLITGERTFDLDLADNTPDLSNPCLPANSQPDGVIDSSGSYFINLSSLLTSRDNARQAVSDLINLTKSVNGLNLDGDALTDDLDETRIYFVGHSLGGIVGTTLLGVNGDIRAATLAMPGGGVARLLDASKAFGPRITAGLACSGVVEGTDTYETFLRFAQHVVDSADPINFAAAAAADRPIHMIEVIGDAVVPNSTPATAGTATLDKVTIAGYLSGTDPLYQAMGADVIGPLAVPVGALSLNVDLTRATDYVVQFSTGDHGSILSPAASPAATVEMQRQTANFLASDGICLPVGGSCS